MTQKTYPVLPYDRELAVALPLINPIIDLVPETIQVFRDSQVSPTPEELIAGRAISHQTRIIDGPNGQIELSVFRPAPGANSGAAVYFVHGGGMIMCDKFTGVDEYVDLVADLGVVTVTVEYRLAPEHPDPAPIEDVYSGLVWLHDHAAELGVDPARIVAAGTSAGGGLTAGLALLARDRGGPPILAQLLNCPMLDDRNTTASSHAYVDRNGIWDRRSNFTGWQALLGDRFGGPDVSIYAAPARATDLTGLPQAYLDVGTAELFRDEDIAYATALLAAGVQTEIHAWAGGFHSFELLAPDTAVSRACRAARRDWLERVIRDSDT